MSALKKVHVQLQRTVSVQGVVQVPAHWSDDDVETTALFFDEWLMEQLQADQVVELQAEISPVVGDPPCELDPFTDDELGEAVAVVGEAS